MKTLLATILLLAATSAIQAQTFTVAGTMRHTTLEGGCWYLETADSQHYELFGDTAIIRPLHVVGLTTRLSVEHMKGVASICMVGDIVRVVERLDTKRQPLDPNIHSVDVRGTMHRTKSGVWYVKTDHASYEFQQPPATKYLHENARFHRRVSIVMASRKCSFGEKMNGMIFPDAPKKKSGALRKIENHDPR